jgi:hypothetical protein
MKRNIFETVRQLLDSYDDVTRGNAVHTHGNLYGDSVSNLSYLMNLEPALHELIEMCVDSGIQMEPLTRVIDITGWERSPPVPQADDSVARYAAVFAADAGEQALYLNRTTDEVADLCVAVADEVVKRRDAALAKGEDYYAMAFVETAASWLSNHPRATFLELCHVGQREVDLLKGDGK